MQENGGGLLLTPQLATVITFSMLYAHFYFESSENQICQYFSFIKLLSETNKFCHLFLPRESEN